MSQAINIAGNLVVSNNNFRNQVNLQYTLSPTGSNSVANTANVTTGSWTVLDQGSNADFRFGYFANLDLTSSVKICIGSTASIASYLFPEDAVILTNSGSSVIYAQATGSNGTVLLQYFVSER